MRRPPGRPAFNLDRRCAYKASGDAVAEGDRHRVGFMHVRIIGGGVAGLTAAVEFARRGASIELFEKKAATGLGCSWFAGGMLAPWCELESAEPLVVSMGEESLAFWKKEYAGTRNGGSIVLAPARDLPDLKRFARRTERYDWIDGERLAALEPDLAGRFSQALYFSEEGHLDPRGALSALTARLAAMPQVKLHFETAVDPEADTDRYDWTIDARGHAAKDRQPQLRGVRGEMLVLRTQEVSLSRPVRLVHPRHPVYIVPREDHRFMVGATMIESEQRGGITARSMVELLNAAYAVHPAFGEAEIIETGADLRPSFADNLPRLRRTGERELSLNGLYRHGFLLAPALAQRAVAFALDGIEQPDVMRD